MLPCSRTAHCVQVGPAPEVPHAAQPGAKAAAHGQGGPRAVSIFADTKPAPAKVGMNVGHMAHPAVCICIGPPLITSDPLTTSTALSSQWHLIRSIPFKVCSEAGTHQACSRV